MKTNEQVVPSRRVMLQRVSDGFQTEEGRRYTAHSHAPLLSPCFKRRKKFPKTSTIYDLLKRKTGTVKTCFVCSQYHQHFPQQLRVLEHLNEGHLREFKFTVLSAGETSIFHLNKPQMLLPDFPLICQFNIAKNRLRIEPPGCFQAVIPIGRTDQNILCDLLNGEARKHDSLRV